MKRNAFPPAMILIYFLLFCCNVSAQLPTCNNPAGLWHNQLSANLTILSVDTATGAFTGTYESPSEAPGTKFPLFGWINPASVVGGMDNVTPISFGVRWTSLGGLTTWTGYCREVAGVPTITALWHHVNANSQLSSNHILANTDNFISGAPGEVAINPDSLHIADTGWLLYDFEHTGQSFGTNPHTGAPFRHTVWEIHPVTGLTEINN